MSAQLALAAPAPKAAPRPVSRAHDADEREAERAAEVVAEGGSVAGWSFSSVPVSAATQVSRHVRTCGCAGTCPECRAAKVRRSARAASAAPSVDPGLVAPVLRTPGRPLEPGARSFFESRLGADFSDVRVHADSAAARSADSLHASAYAAGRDIVFGEGHYAPATREGRRLIAHELVHVLQQASGRVPAHPTVRPPGDSFEREAENVAERVAAGAAAVRAPAKGGEAQTQAVQRQAESEESEEPTKSDDEELYRPDGEAESREPEKHEELPVQLSREGGTPVIQRQPAPPPVPHVFPHFTEWYGGIAAAAADAWAFTCKDRKERGFHILWNEQTNQSRPDTLTVSDAEAAIDIPRPPDRDPVFVVGWFHTHPRPKPGFVQVAVGPSDKDKKTSSDTGLPGAVRDFLTPGVTDCAKAGTFFFGPERRAPQAR
jgi:hypothetical protein